jgi:hypothetical protein
VAEFGVFKNAFVSIGGVDLSDHVREIRLPRGVEALDDTVMGDDTRSEGPGLLTWGGTVVFTQDYAASQVDATLNAAVGTVVAVIFRPDTAAVGVTNPQWAGNALVKAYEPISGAVGDHLETTVELGPAGDITRTTA